MARHRQNRCCSLVYLPPSTLLLSAIISSLRGEQCAWTQVPAVMQIVSCGGLQTHCPSTTSVLPGSRAMRFSHRRPDCSAVAASVRASQYLTMMGVSLGVRRRDSPRVWVRRGRRHRR